MESFDTFKRKPRYRGLSKQEVRQRYNDYLRSQPGSEIVPRKRSTRHERAVARFHDQVTEYVLSLIDPFDHVARVPDYSGLKTVMSQYRSSVVLGTNESGNAAFFMRDGLSAVWCASCATDPSGYDFSVAADCDELMPYIMMNGGLPNASVDNGALATFPDATAWFSGNVNNAGATFGGNSGFRGGGWWAPIGGEHGAYNTHQNLDGMGPAVDAQCRTTALYRVTSFGFRVTYIAPPLNASGTIVGFELPPGSDWPVASSNGFTPAAFANTAISYTDAAAFHGAKEYPLVHGIEVVSRGYASDGAVSSFRPTKLRNAVSCNYVNGCVPYLADTGNIIPSGSPTVPYATVGVSNGPEEGLKAVAGLSEFLSGVNQNYTSYSGYALTVATNTATTFTGGTLSNYTRAQFLNMQQSFDAQNITRMLGVVVTGAPVKTAICRIEMVSNVESIPISRAFNYGVTSKPAQHPAVSKAAELVLEENPGLTVRAPGEDFMSRAGKVVKRAVPFVVTKFLPEILGGLGVDASTSAAIEAVAGAAAGLL